MPFVRQMEKQFERGKKGQLISKKFAKSKVAVKITVVVVVDEIGHLASISVMELGSLPSSMFMGAQLLMKDQVLILKGGARGGRDEPG